MASQKNKFIKFLQRVAPNAIWDGVKWIGGSSMLTFAWKLWRAEFVEHAADWYLLLFFFVGALLVIIANFMQRKNGSTAEQDHAMSLENAETTNQSLTSGSDLLDLTPLQIEILNLLKDLRQFVKDAGDQPKIELTNPGPMPRGANPQMWMELQQIDTDKWERAQLRWMRRFLGDYQQKFADRIKRLMRSIGASSGLVVASLDPYTKSITPNEGIAELRGILWGLLGKLDKDATEFLGEQSQLPVPTVERMTIRILEAYFGVTPNDSARYVILLQVRVDGPATKLKECTLKLERGGKSWKAAYQQPIIAAQPIEFVPGIKGVVNIEKENKHRLIPGSALDPLVPSRGYLHFTAENCDARFPDLLRGATFVLAAIGEEKYQATCTELAAEWLHPAVIVAY